MHNDHYKLSKFNNLPHAILLGEEGRATEENQKNGGDYNIGGGGGELTAVNRKQGVKKDRGMGEWGDGEMGESRDWGRKGAEMWQRGGC